MNKEMFAVIGDDTLSAVVRAEDSDEAFDVFAKGIKDDDLINEQIRSFTVNDSLFETFVRMIKVIYLKMDFWHQGCN